jgi:tetratricopeptide (TPR) repeat protein
MLRNILIVSLVLIASVGLVQRALSQDDVEGTLNRAQALYYEARFKDSVELLLPIDASLRQRPDRVAQSINVKLQLALGYIGQNQIAEAKSVFREVCALDGDHALDSEQFAPKVLALFEDARTEQKKAKCDAFCGKLDQVLKDGDSQGLVRLSREAGGNCFCGAGVAAADLLYTQGVGAFKTDDFAQALAKFQAALKFNPRHDLAVQYAELAESKIKFTIDRLLLDWRKSFDAQEYPRASTLYRQLESTNIEGKADSALEQMRGEYRRIAANKVEVWNFGCSGSASPSFETFRQEARDLLPNETLAGDLISKASPCAPKVVAKSPEVKPLAAQSCLQMSSQQAMVRVKSQVSPDIPRNMLSAAGVNIAVKVKIDENGNVAVKEVTGENRFINEAMRTAIEKWKFFPAILEDQRRCVETELPVVLNRQ